MYHLARVFGLNRLEIIAINVLNQAVSIALTSSEAPPDLAAALRFMYVYLRGHKEIRAGVLQYVMQRWSDHRIGYDPEMLELAEDFEGFILDLFVPMMGRDYQEDCELIIIYSTKISITHISLTLTGTTSS